MAVVKVKEKFQVTLPARLREQAGVHVGDFLEARVEGDRITLTPKSLVEGRLAEALEDVRERRVHGPFGSHEEMLKSLHSKTAKGRLRKRPRK